MSTEDQGIELPWYVCAVCQEHIVPAYVRRMESIEPAHSDVAITYHCVCLGDPDAYASARYYIVPMGVAYLFGFSDGFDHVHEYGTGGWYYENPLPQRPVPHYDPRLEEMREELQFCNTPADLFRLCGLRYEESSGD